MTWKRFFSGISLLLLLILITGTEVMAATKVSTNDLVKKSLAETKKINDSCLKCHNEPANTGHVPGQAPYVDQDRFINSLHGTTACTSCHYDMQADLKKHEVIVGGRELAKKVNISCQKCHLDITKVYEKSTHGLLFLEGKDTALCTDCHGSHDIRKATDKESTVNGKNSVETCVKCHEHKYKETYEESFHGRAIHLGSVKAATCVSCHGSHAILAAANPESSINKANIPKTCAQCHLKANPNFANGTEHAELKAEGPGATTYWTLKFFTWLTIIVVAMLMIHIELELYRRYQEIKRHGRG